MAVLNRVILFLSFLACFVAVKAEYCIPGPVSNITLSNSNIYWSAADNPNNCTINGYIIKISDSEEGTEFQLTADSTVLSYNLYFLDGCKTYTFEIRALTLEFVLGPPENLVATTSPPKDINLTITFNNIFLSGNQVELTWKVDPAATKCITYYRVVYWDVNNSPTDVYVRSQSFVLEEDLVPCMKYTFQVMAIANDPNTEGPWNEISWDKYEEVSSPPKIISMVPGNTTVNMTWGVPKYSEHRCQLKALIVETLGLPASIATTRIAIEDSVLRPNVEVFLTGLEPDTVYTSKVCLENSAGYSRNITVIFQTSESYIFNYDRDVINN